MIAQGYVGMQIDILIDIQISTKLGTTTNPYTLDTLNEIHYRVLQFTFMPAENTPMWIGIIIIYCYDFDIIPLPLICHFFIYRAKSYPCMLSFDVIIRNVLEDICFDDFLGLRSYSFDVTMVFGINFWHMKAQQGSPPFRHLSQIYLLRYWDLSLSFLFKNF